MLDDFSPRELLLAARPFVLIGLVCAALTGAFLAPAGWGLALLGAALIGPAAAVLALLVWGVWSACIGA